MNFAEYTTYDGLGLAGLVRRGQVTPAELRETALAAIEALNPSVNAVCRTLDNQRWSPDGPFAGAPFLIKDFVLHAAGVPMNMGSRLTEGLTLAHDTELTARFRRAGLATIGVTTTPEFGYNTSTEAVLYGGPTRNPWNLARSPGGSSGGSAAAVAAGIAPMAHANDAGGSIRVPASCCGLIGLKPTRGRIPTGPDYGDMMHGIAIEFAVTRSVRDTAALLDAVAGPDAGAPYWPAPPTRPFLDEVATPPGRLRIAYSAVAPTGIRADKEVEEALMRTAKLCEDLGHQVEEAAPEVDAGQFGDAISTIWIANIAHIIESLGRAMGRRPSPENLEAANWAAYERAKTLPAGALLEAVGALTPISRAAGRFFTRYDVMLTPTVARPPLALGELNANDPSITAEEWPRRVFGFAPYSSLFNFTGQPAISLPLEWSADGLPAGMQFAARFGDEATLFRLAAQLEQARPIRLPAPIRPKR